MDPPHGNAFQCKLICVGDCHVGKTTMLLRYLKDQADQNIPATLGVSYIHRKIVLNGNTYHLTVSDTAGQEKFAPLVPMYYNRADFAFIVFDLTSPPSFERVKFWESQLALAKNYLERPIQRVVVGNKCDLKERIAISQDIIKKYCAELGLKYYEISALTGENVNEMWEDILTHGNWEPVANVDFEPSPDPPAKPDKRCC